MWFLLALVGPFLYAVTNYIDKALLERYFKCGGVETLLVFSAALSALALPILWLLDPTVLYIQRASMAALSLVGLLNVLVLFFYLKALESEEVSVAVIFYQLVPVFAYAFGYLFLGESLSRLQLSAMGMVILGTSLVSFEKDTVNGLRLRTKTIAYMVTASMCWALESVVFKVVALKEEVVPALFWEHFALSVLGATLICFSRECRTSFVNAVRENSRAIFSLNVLNEGLYMLGNATFAFAYLRAPIALILLAESYQPVFTIMIGLLVDRFSPGLIQEGVRMTHLWQKVSAAFITGAGTYLLVSGQ